MSHSPSSSSADSSPISDPAAPSPAPSILDSSGLVIVDKPAGMTSHDVVARLRRFFGTRRVGHSGTLDPMATGVLVVGVERGTKFLAHVVTHDKRYQATIALGAKTLTDDVEGEFTSITDPSIIDALTADDVHDQLEVAFKDFRGDIMQRPTSVSSIKINGRRAHELVREGHDVKLPERPVTIYSRDWGGVRKEHTEDGPRWMVDVTVHCSSGTYIRAIARDLGDKLGLGGYLTALRRTSVGPFFIQDAIPLEQLAEHPTLSLDLDTAMTRCFPVRTIDEAQAHALSLGQKITPNEDKQVYAAATADGRAVALVKNQGKAARTVFVARPAGMC